MYKVPVFPDPRSFKQAYTRRQSSKQHRQRNIGNMKLLALLALPAPILAAVSGRCSGSYNDNRCICLDKDVCRNRWGGTPVEGVRGDFPCPNDPSNVWGCYIMANCPTKGSDTGCTWRNGCPGTILRGKAIAFKMLLVGVNKAEL